MMSHSKSVHRTIHMAARLKGFVPDRMKSALGSSALLSTPGMARLRRTMMTVTSSSYQFSYPYCGWCRLA